jgi:hypothetical protein
MDSPAYGLVGAPDYVIWVFDVHRQKRCEVVHIGGVPLRVAWPAGGRLHVPCVSLGLSSEISPASPFE